MNDGTKELLPVKELETLQTEQEINLLVFL